MVAVGASRTVDLTVTGLPVGADRLTGRRRHDEWTRDEAAGSTLNGFLALGVAQRCCHLLGPSPLDGRLADCHAALLAAEPAGVPAARAAASALAMRAAATLTVHTGSRSVRRDEHAQRLAREALFLLVFATRPAIRAALLAELSGP
jgi:hypothetical protein